MLLLNFKFACAVKKTLYIRLCYEGKKQGKSIFTHYDSIDPERRAVSLFIYESFLNLHILTCSSNLACISIYVHA